MSAPDPFVPPEVDLRDYPSIQLEFRRLFGSDTWVLGNNDERVAALHLWCESWHQVPAASLPDDERMLAHLSGSGARWRRVREHALKGWVLCSDGRLYHPVVAEKAIEAWETKRDKSRRGKAGALRRWGASNAQAGLLDSGSISGDSPSIAREEKGREEKKGLKPTTPFPLPEWVDPKAWGGFVEMRSKMKHPLTDRAKELTIADLEALRAQGQDPNACLDQSVRRGWRGVFAVKGWAQPAPPGRAAIDRFVSRGGHGGG